MLSIIHELIEYNRWAHLLSLGAAEELSSEALHREVESSFPSVFRTLLHLYQAEYVWLSRWNGDPRGAAPDVTDISDVPALRDLWYRFWKEQDAFLDLLTEPDLARRVDYVTRAGVASSQRLEVLLRHVVNHATYHRGQVTTLLRQVGGQPVATDYVLFDRERR